MKADLKQSLNNRSVKTDVLSCFSKPGASHSFSGFWEMAQGRAQGLLKMPEMTRGSKIRVRVPWAAYRKKTPAELWFSTKGADLGAGGIVS